MKIIILGSNGMLGKYMLNSSLFQEEAVIGMSRSSFPSFDFCDPNETIKLIKYFNADVVINCVALTSIAACEQNKNLADEVNTITPSLISEFCLKENIFFVHISTDHFYSGDGRVAHKETDPIELLNYYAVSKFEAEQRILNLNPSALILRTSIIGRTPEGRTFLDWAIKSIESNERVTLFSNAYASFIHCNQLTSIIKYLIARKIAGLYNASCSEVFSKAEFVISLAEAMNCNLEHDFGDVSELNPPRPSSCGLSSLKLIQKTGITNPSMQDVISLVLDEHATNTDFNL